jgi:hypothetical protein
MPPIAETEIKELRDLVISLREEIQVGFANTNTKFVELNAELKGEIQRVEAKTDNKLAEIKGQVDVLEERTKIGFWGFIWRSVIIGILILVSGFAVRYALFGTLKV